MTWQRPIRSGLVAFDCNGDGRDELLVLDGDWPEGRLCAWDRELKELWTWPARSIKAKLAVFDADEIRMQIERARMIDRVISPSAGRQGEVIIFPATGD